MNLTQLFEEVRFGSEADTRRGSRSRSDTTTQPLHFSPIKVVHRDLQCGANLVALDDLDQIFEFRQSMRRTTPGGGKVRFNRKVAVDMMMPPRYVSSKMAWSHDLKPNSSLLTYLCELKRTP